MLDLSGFVPKRTEIEIGTKVFVFRELSISDLAKFRARLVGEREKINKKRRERLIADANMIKGIDPMELLKFSDSTVSDEELEQQMETVEGIGYLAYLSLKYNCIEVSLEDAMNIVTPSSIEEITKAMFPTDDKKKPKQAVTQSKKPQQ